MSDLLVAQRDRPTQKSPSRGSRILGQTYALPTQQSIRRERLSHPLGGVERELVRRVVRRVDRAERAPGEPADGDRGNAGTSERNAVDQNPDGKPATSCRQPGRGEPGRF